MDKNKVLGKVVENQLFAWANYHAILQINQINRGHLCNSQLVFAVINFFAAGSRRWFAEIKEFVWPRDHNMHLKCNKLYELTLKYGPTIVQFCNLVSILKLKLGLGAWAYSCDQIHMKSVVVGLKVWPQTLHHLLTLLDMGAWKIPKMLNFDVVVTPHNV